MQATVIKAESRSDLGTKHTRRLRKAGMLPAVIYGHGEAPESVSLPEHDVLVELGHRSRLLHLNYRGKETPFLIKSVQYDYLHAQPVHLDLMRVNLDEKVKVKVGLELRGTAKGTKEGGVLEQILSDIEVECLLHQIPDMLHPNVAELGIGDSLLVKDIKLPDGVVAITPPDERVATVRTVAEEKPAEAAAEGATEPEVIGRGKTEEGEEEAEK